MIDVLQGAKCASSWPFKGQPHKMVKQTQTIRRLLPTNCLSVFGYFLGLAHKGLTVDSVFIFCVVNEFQLIFALPFWLEIIYRSGYTGVFCEKDFLKNFLKFTRKHLCQSPFFNGVVGLSPATLLKRDSGTGVFLWMLLNI